MLTVNILCVPHHYSELPLLSWAWSYQSFTVTHWNALPLLHDDVAELADILDFAHLHLPLENPQRCSIRFKTADRLGQSITFTLSLFGKAVVVLEVCLGVIVMLEHCLVYPVSGGRGSWSAAIFHSTCWSSCFSQWNITLQHLQHSCSLRQWHSHHHAWL